MLPEFIIIGAQKCGTSSLYSYLIEHPMVAASLRKEVHYFDCNFERGTRWYRAHFPTFAYQRTFRMRTGHRLVTGEASPYYLFHPHAPKRARKVVPNAKLIALLRNPVERVLSAYQHQVRKGREALSLSEAIQREPDRMALETDRLATDETYNSYSHRHFSYVARGIYADQLTTWLRFFPREQVLVIRSEDLFNDPALVLTQVQDFIGLPHWKPSQFERLNAGKYAGMDPSVRDWLTRYFVPHNARLYDLLGRDLGWPR